MAKRRRVLVTLLTTALVALPLLAAPMNRGVPEGSIDDEFVKFNEAVPGFGGLFYDSQDRLTVYVQTRAQAKRARAELGDDVRVLRGRYEFRELQDWRLKMRGLLDLPGVVTLDVDERTNRVRVGIEPENLKRSRRALRQRLREAGIPRRAVKTSARRAMIPMQTVQDFVRPIPGGVQINFPGFLCTLGFNIEIGNRCYFATNDHCTETSGQNDGTEYWQPLQSTHPTRIGREVFDAPFFTGAGCFPGFRCRFSDSAFARYDNAADCEFAMIARTPILSLNYDNPDRWKIISKQLSPVLGQHVAKQGRTTGRTEGDVSATCVDTQASGTNIVRLCQAFVDNGGGTVVGGGDSGSPVFRRRVSTSQAQLVGILWGGNAQGTEFVYSPMEGVETDVGRSLPVF